VYFVLQSFPPGNAVMTTAALAKGRRTISTAACKTLLPVLLLVSNLAYAGFDHELALDQSGIWSRNYQTGLEFGVIAVEVAGSLWFGNDEQLGHTFWQTMDASAISGIGAVVMKRGFSRARPSQGGNPNQWFKGSCCESFPSGEVTLQASFVTPFIANYAREHPWVWSLELLPVYDAIARMKSQAHWQSDVIAGWILGSAVGYWTTTRETPFSVQILPRGVSAGFYKRF
jgi:undecaprenyl-diphosphatase